MITKYSDFLTEAAISLICESQVHYSPRFRELLKDIESPVAIALLAMELQDLEVASNYLDLSDNKDQLTFISDKRARELEASTARTYHGRGALTHNMSANGDIFGLLGYEPEGQRPTSPEDGQKVEVVGTAVSPTSGREYCLITFQDNTGQDRRCVVRKEYLRHTADMFTVGRQPVRTGRLVRAMLAAAGQTFPDRDIEDFVNKFKAAHDRINDAMSRFKVIRGDDLAKTYHYSNYTHGTRRGTIGNSCMAAVDSDYFDIYSKNPDKCGLVVLRDNTDRDKITARALVWNLDLPQGVTFLDRVYYTNDDEQELFREYARKMGWHSKQYNNSSPSGMAIAPDGTEVDLGTLEVRIKSDYQGGYSNYPYVDTVKFVHVKSGGWVLSTREMGSDYLLESTGGDRLETSCDFCGGDGRVDCPECSGDGNLECATCDGRGENTCRNCSGEGEVGCESCGGSGCESCSGGRVSCTECDGGSVECGTCEGSGNDRCDSCRGTGRRDCPECQ
jgi:hypothetical protein